MKTAHDLVTAAKAATHEISVQDAAQAIREADVLLDVREADEFAAGHLPGAIHASRGLLEFKLSASPEMSNRDLRVVLLGAVGGAGRAIAVQCAMDRCERLVLVNRTLEKIRPLAEDLAPYFQSEKLSGPAERIVAIPFDDEALRRELKNADILINATSLGMKRTDPPAILPALLTANLLVYDTVYAGGTSRLLEDAAAAGARCANGLGMLLHQGALSFEIWLNRAAPLEEMRDALHSIL